ncbi:hypothetical protein EVAR_103406_1 [Eumeta japonica]|uniref:Uncharacterized protein n=1 Tax=Eumeta variegata TaxID=151549 RepID=A0A4C1YVK1_EUMVA|nr:hypothetical protein EVAR_103406_1 [Eumeta japonica]
MAREENQEEPNLVASLDARAEPARAGVTADLCPSAFAVEKTGGRLHITRYLDPVLDHPAAKNAVELARSLSLNFELVHIRVEREL